MVDEADLTKTVGMADICELLSRAFAYPDDGLAAALVDGSLAEDCHTCSVDAGLKIPPEVSALEDAGGPAPDLRARLGREYSRLFLNPVRTPIFPYESAFIHVAHGCEGRPALFRTRVTLDVEAQMREAGVVAKDGRSEPCDSVSDEFAFLAYLYGSLAASLQRDDACEAGEWRLRVGRFLEGHAMRWLPGFMEMVIEQTTDPVYVALARIGGAALARMRGEEAGGAADVRAGAELNEARRAF